MTVCPRCGQEAKHYSSQVRYGCDTIGCEVYSFRVSKDGHYYDIIIGLVDELDRYISRYPYEGNPYERTCVICNEPFTLIHTDVDELFDKFGMISMFLTCKECWSKGVEEIPTETQDELIRRVGNSQSRDREWLSLCREFHKDPSTILYFKPKREKHNYMREFY